MLGSETVLESTHVVEQLSFSMIWIWLKFGVIFVFWGPKWAGFGVRVCFNNCFGVYSFSWTTFILYVSVYSNIWFLLNFGHFWLFEAQLGYFSSWMGLTMVFGSIRVVEQLSFSMILLILIFDFDLILGSFFTFLGPNELFGGWSRVQLL